MRMLVRLGGADAFLGSPTMHGHARRGSGMRSMGLSELGDGQDEAARANILQRLVLTLQVMEGQVRRYTWSRTVAANLHLLDETFSLTPAEKAIFVLAAQLRADDALLNIAESCKSQVDVTDQLRRITGIPMEQIVRAVSPQGTLRRAGLLTVSSGHHPASNLTLQRGRLRCLVTTRLKSVDQLFSSVLVSAHEPSLSPRDYPHLSPSFDFVFSVMEEALKSRRRGVNVLLYGPPGTGKTELTAVIAAQAAVPLFNVSCVDENGLPVGAEGRLSNGSTAQYLLKGRRALLVFDEIDAIFTDGSAFFGKPTTAERLKAWVNELLEGSQVPTFWVANSIWNMDPAFVRRFDVVVEMKAPPMLQRVELLTSQCGKMLDAGQIRRIAQVESITPALVDRAVGVMRRTRVAPGDRATTLEALLDGTLSAQGHKTIKRASHGQPAQGYDPDLCNASLDLRALAAGIGRSGTGRICFYGPPGTGKTAFGYWLADQLGKPLVLKRVSDIQSPMLGVMERNLALAFDRASRDGAVLQIDEVDTFLRDRREVRQSWEVSQVNEFLTQLEGYDGVLIASTNLMNGLDQAALRRFDHKVEMGYLLPHQTGALLVALLRQCRLDEAFAPAAGQPLAALRTLTPGDFAVVARQHRIVPFTCPDDVVNALAAEVAGKEHSKPHRIGFV